MCASTEMELTMIKLMWTYCYYSVAALAGHPEAVTKHYVHEIIYCIKYNHEIVNASGTAFHLCKYVASYPVAIFIIIDMHSGGK